MSLNYAYLQSVLAGLHPGGAAYSADNATALAQLYEENIEVNKNTTPQEAADATDGTEFNSASLSDTQRQMWISVLGWETLNLNAGIGLETATGMWNSGSTPLTKAALIATRTTNVSHHSQITGSAELNYSGSLNENHLQSARDWS